MSIEVGGDRDLLLAYVYRLHALVAELETLPLERIEAACDVALDIVCNEELVISRGYAQAALAFRDRAAAVHMGGSINA